MKTLMAIITILINLYVAIIFSGVYGCGDSGGGDNNNPNSQQNSADPDIDNTPPAHIIWPSNDIIDNNPVIAETVTMLNFPMYSGFNPPIIEGEYLFSGEVVDIDEPESLIGKKSSSTIILSDQSGNRIRYKEIINNITVTGNGDYYITGSGKSFTLVVIVSANFAGCNVKNCAIMSGSIVDNGNLEISTLTINIEKSNCENVFVVKWYEMDGIMKIQSSKTIELSPSISTYINSRYPDTSFAEISNPFSFCILTGNYYPYSVCSEHGLLKFDNLPSNAIIENAKLEMTNVIHGDPGTTSIYRIYENWNKDVTFNTQPNRSYPKLCSNNVDFSKSDTYHWDLTNIVQQWVYGSFSNNGILVDTTFLSGDISLGEFSKSSIKLIITYRPK
jgi:hypothetical protein